MRKLSMYAMKAAVVTVHVCLFWYTWLFQYSSDIELPFFNRGNTLLVIVYAVMLVAFTILYGGYKVGYLSGANVTYSQLLALLFVNGLMYFQISLIGRGLADPAPMFVLTVVEVIVTLLWVHLAAKVYYSLYAPKRLAAVTGGDSGQHLINKMNARKDKYEICAVVSAEKDLAEIVESVRLYDGVVVSDVKGEKRNDILKFCFEHSIPAYLAPKISDILLRGAVRVHLFDTPLLLCANSGFTTEQQFLKRTVDVTVAAFALTVLWPLMAAVAVGIKLYDGGPILYRQDRLTQGGKVSTLYKFRSMVVNAEKDGIARMAAQNDARVTPIGRFIRKVRIDELPQLFNVVAGDMSLVGPRPERPEIAAQYAQAMPEFSFRTKVKAGITGYAQVLGRYNSTPYDKLKLDLLYIENYSLLMDLKLMLLTLKILLMPESTEGVADGGVTAGDAMLRKRRGKRRGKR